MWVGLEVLKDFPHVADVPNFSSTPVRMYGLVDAPNSAIPM
jgi:hypothetical protein